MEVLVSDSSQIQLDKVAEYLYTITLPGMTHPEEIGSTESVAMFTPLVRVVAGY